MLQTHTHSAGMSWIFMQQSRHSFSHSSQDGHSSCWASSSASTSSSLVFFLPRPPPIPASLPALLLSSRTSWSKRCFGFAQCTLNMNRTMFSFFYSRVKYFVDFWTERISFTWDLYDKNHFIYLLRCAAHLISTVAGNFFRNNNIYFNCRNFSFYPAWRQRRTYGI